MTVVMFIIVWRRQEQACHLPLACHDTLDLCCRSWASCTAHIFLNTHKSKQLRRQHLKDMVEPAVPNEELWSMKAKKQFNLHLMSDQASWPPDKSCHCHCHTHHASVRTVMCAVLNKHARQQSRASWKVLYTQEHSADQQAKWQAYVEDRTEVCA